VDARLEVTVAGKDGGGDQVAVLDCLLDVRVEGSGVTDAGGVSLVAASVPGVLDNTSELIKEAAKCVGGGGGGKGDIATAGGKNPEGLSEALRMATEKARAVLGLAP
jgi:alanyl-tRNA synthetase